MLTATHPEDSRRLHCSCAELSEHRRFFPRGPLQRSLTTKAVKAHLHEQTGPEERVRDACSHMSKQTSYQTMAPSNSNVGG